MLGVIALLLQITVTAPANVELIWEAISQCSKDSSTRNLADVVWRVDSLISQDRNHRTLALWIRPDTIVFDYSVDYDAWGWIVGHELLHYRLQNPDHPFQPFWFPCKVMPEQHGFR